MYSHCQVLSCAKDIHLALAQERLPRASKTMCCAVSHTGAFTHRCFYTEDELHTETCAHNTLLQTTNFYTERFCFPFLITYLSGFVEAFAGLQPVFGFCSGHFGAQMLLKGDAKQWWRTPLIYLYVTFSISRNVEYPWPCAEC